MKTILVVDDEQDIRNTVKTILEKNNYKVVTAVSADDCMNKLIKTKPDLILLDIMMPGTTVREIVPRIKGTKIIYLTAVQMSEAEREELMKDKKIVDFINKPYDIDELLKRVKRAVGA